MSGARALAAQRKAKQSDSLQFFPYPPSNSLALALSILFPSFPFLPLFCSIPVFLLKRFTAFCFLLFCFSILSLLFRSPTDGQMISPNGPSPCTTGSLHSASSAIIIIGRVKTKVFPLPVKAIPIISAKKMMMSSLLFPFPSFFTSS